VLRALLVLALLPATLGSDCEVSTGGLSDSSVWRESWPGGIGAILGYNASERRLFVREVPADTPSAEVGLRAGDEIVQIDGHDVSALELPEIVDALRGEVGSQVKLRVRRADETFDVDVMRAPYRE